MSLWGLNTLVFFTGLVLELGSIWLLLAQTHLPLPVAENPLVVAVSLARSVLGLLMVAFIVQIVAVAFMPAWPVAGLWFILAAALSLIPAWLLRRALRRGATGLLPTQPAATSTVPAPSTSASLDFDLRLQKVQQVIAAHPEGVTLVQLGTALGIEWRQLTGVARELLRRGLVEKDGKVYRPRVSR
jgi:hypothetical protein